MKFTSRVIHGQQHGRTIGYPTANLEVTEVVKQALKKEGVYAVRVGLGDKKYSGALFYGRRSLFKDERRVCEVLLIDFDGDLYGQEVEIEMLRFLRAAASVRDNKELEKLIEEDIKKIRLII